MSRLILFQSTQQLKMDKKTETGNVSSKATDYIEALRIFAMVNFDRRLWRLFKCSKKYSVLRQTLEDKANDAQKQKQLKQERHDAGVALHEQQQKLAAKHTGAASRRVSLHYLIRT
jgi:hypothetical protein